MASPALEQRLHVAVESGIPLDGDPRRLAQVISHLPTNAAKYTEPGGRVALDGHVEDNHVILRVSDTGIGIDPTCTLCP